MEWKIQLQLIIIAGDFKIVVIKKGDRLGLCFPFGDSILFFKQLKNSLLYNASELKYPVEHELIFGQDNLGCTNGYTRAVLYRIRK